MFLTDPSDAKLLYSSRSFVGILQARLNGDRLNSKLLIIRTSQMLKTINSISVGILTEKKRGFGIRQKLSGRIP
jgi:hypothetical protein